MPTPSGATPSLTKQAFWSLAAKSVGFALALALPFREVTPRALCSCHVP
jgi:hypothetical protein